MGASDRRWRGIASLALALLLALPTASPAAPADPEQAPPPTPPDTAEIRALPGYQAGKVSFSSFPGQTYVMEAGTEEGPPAILIHGIAADGAHDWDALVPALAPHQRVIAMDLPGFGRSSRPDAPYTPETYADLVEELIETRVDGAFDLVAHSLGVSVALEVVRRQPRRVRRLVLADGAALLHGQALSLEEIEKQQEDLGPLGAPLGWVRNGAFDLMGHVPDRFMYRLAVGIPGEAAQRAAAGVMAHDSSAALDAVRSPTLVIWGRQDEVASLRGAWALVSRIDGARIAFVESAGHSPMRETPRAFNDLTLRWLSGKEVGRALDPPDPSPDRDDSCKGNRGTKTFRGAYRKITIENCDDVVLEGVRAREIDIASATVSGRDVVVQGDSVAISLFRSRLKLSGARLRADVPMKIKGGEVDLAGVELQGQRAAVEAIGDAKVLCSLCGIEAEGETGQLHGFFALHAGQTLSPTIQPR